METNIVNWHGGRDGTGKATVPGEKVPGTQFGEKAHTRRVEASMDIASEKGME